MIKGVKLFQTNEKAMGHEGDGDTNYKWCSRNDPQKLREEAGGVGHQSKSRDRPNYSIVEVSQNT